MAQVSFKRGTNEPPQTGVVDGALYLKEGSEKFDLYFGGEKNKIFKLNAATADKATCLQSPGSSTSLGYLDWTGSQENCNWFATWDEQTYSGKPTVRAMNASNVRKNLSVYSQAESNALYVKLNSSNSGFLSISEFLSAPTVGNGNNYIAFPNGGQYEGSGSNIGFLEIALPEAAYKSNTMVKFKVSIFNYVTSTSVDYIISGYTYQTSPYWYQMTALCLGKKGQIHSNHTVRFGYDDTRMYIYIGESNTEWSYPNITISDITIGHSGTFDKWKNDWRISIINSISANLHSTIFQNTSLVYETYQADKLSTIRSIQTNLASTSAASFDGSGDISPGVTGILPIANGGTGATEPETALKNLTIINDRGGACIGKGATTTDGGAMGCLASAMKGGAVGQNATAIDGFAGGYGAKALVGGAVQLGEGQNDEDQSLQFRNIKIIDRNGYFIVQNYGEGEPPSDTTFTQGSIYYKIVD